MQKRLAVLFVILGATLAASAQHTVTLNWKNAATPWTPCSATVTTACEDHKIINDVSYPPAIITVANSIAPSAVTTTFNAPSPSYSAAHLYNLVIVYKDITGATQFDAPATCGSGNTAPPCSVTGFPVDVPPVPTGFTGTYQ
jgi:hypothetical protein